MDGCRSDRSWRRRGPAGGTADRIRRHVVRSLLHLRPETLDPDALINIKEVDSLLIGEEEAALMEFAAAFYAGKNYFEIQNFWFRKPDGGVQKNPLRKLIDNLDQLPYPDHSFYSPPRLIDALDGSLPVLASRGCDGNCLICPLPHMKNIYRNKGEYRRYRTPGHIIGEILEMKARCDFNRVVFLDPIFPAEKKWLREFSRLYRSRINLPFQISSAPGKMTSDVLDSLSEAGCCRISLSLFTGNESFRNRVSDQKISNKEIVQIVGDLKRRKINVYITFMTGFPLETKELAEQTINFAETLHPAGVSVNIYHPVPATRLYDYCSNNGYISTRDYRTLKEGESVLDLPYYSSEEIGETFNRLRHLNCRMKISKLSGKKGYCDILSKFPDLSSSAYQRLPVTCNQYTLGGESEPAFAQIPNTKASFPVKIEENTYLDFSTGLEPSLYPFAPNDQFRFTIALISDREEKILFEKYLSPGKNPEDAKWRHYSLPILDCPPGKATIRLEYRTSFKKGRILRGLWGRPFLTTVTSEKSLEVSSFSEQEFLDLKKRLSEAEKKVIDLHKDNSILREKNGDLKKEIEKLLELTGKLQEEILQLNLEKQDFSGYLRELEQIRDNYEKSLKGKLRKIFRKK